MAPKEKLFKAQSRAVSGFWPVLRDFQLAGPDFDPFWVTVSGFQPRTPLNVERGANQGRKWIQDPQDWGMPCYQLSEPLFLDPTASTCVPPAVWYTYAGMGRHTAVFVLFRRKEFDGVDCSSLAGT